jgi:hypothetical protein
VPGDALLEIPDDPRPVPGESAVVHGGDVGGQDGDEAAVRIVGYPNLCLSFR